MKLDDYPKAGELAACWPSGGPTVVSLHPAGRLRGGVFYLGGADGKAGDSLPVPLRDDEGWAGRLRRRLQGRRPRPPGPGGRRRCQGRLCRRRWPPLGSTARSRCRRAPRPPRARCAGAERSQPPARAAVWRVTAASAVTGLRSTAVRLPARHHRPGMTTASAGIRHGLGPRARRLHRRPGHPARHRLHGRHLAHPARHDGAGRAHRPGPGQGQLLAYLVARGRRARDRRRRRGRPRRRQLTGLPCWAALSAGNMADMRWRTGVDQGHQRSSRTAMRRPPAAQRCARPPAARRRSQGADPGPTSARTPTTSCRRRDP